MSNSEQPSLWSLWVCFAVSMVSISSLAYILYKLILLQYRGYLMNVRRTSTKFFVRMSIITISDVIVSFLCLFYIPFEIITGVFIENSKFLNDDNCQLLLCLQYSLFFISRLLYHFGNLSRLRLMTENGRFEMSSFFYLFNFASLFVTMIILPIFLLYYGLNNENTRSRTIQNNIQLCQFVGFIYKQSPVVSTLMIFYALVDLLFIASIHYIVSQTFYKV